MRVRRQVAAVLRKRGARRLQRVPDRLARPVEAQIGERRPPSGGAPQIDRKPVEAIRRIPARAATSAPTGKASSNSNSGGVSKPMLRGMRPISGATNVSKRSSASERVHARE